MLGMTLTQGQDTGSSPFLAPDAEGRKEGFEDPNGRAQSRGAQIQGTVINSQT